ncbi:MAG: hypothetical protein BroJett029_15010 [Alphaproteobacteria bacterium]|nr:MAG: hypothetical protein BroJett029_15010 [Alphaproteobacteria bacterium]
METAAAFAASGGPAVSGMAPPAIAAASAGTVAAQFADSALANPPPVYPRQARRLGQEGQVLLRVEVSADGRARAVHVSVSSGHPLLDTAARDAVARWRFHPAQQGGVAVEGTVDVPVLFRLNG